MGAGVRAHFECGSTCYYVVNPSDPTTPSTVVGSSCLDPNRAPDTGDSYYVSKATLKGTGLSGRFMAFVTSWNSTDDEYPVIDFNGLNLTSYGFADQTVGTRENPVVINSPSVWNSFLNTDVLTSAHIKLGQDLDFTGQDFSTLVTGSYGRFFSGVFDGDYKTLNNVEYERRSNADFNGGIFGWVFGGELRDLYFEDNVADIRWFTDFSVTPFSGSTANSYGSIVIKVGDSTRLRNIHINNSKILFNYSFNGAACGRCRSSSLENIVVEDLEMDSTAGNSNYSGSVVGTAISTFMSDIKVSNSILNNIGRYSGGVTGSSTYKTRMKNIDVSGFSLQAASYDSTTNGYHGGVVGLIDDKVWMTNIFAMNSDLNNGEFALGGLVGSSRNVTVENAYTDVLINGTPDSTQCAGGVGFVSKNGAEYHHAWFKDSFFISRINCGEVVLASGGNPKVFGVANRNTPFYDAANVYDGNVFWFNNPDDNANLCYDQASGLSFYTGANPPGCLDPSSKYYWDSEAEVLNFLTGNKVFDTVVNGGLNWDSVYWVQETPSSLPKLRMFTK